MPGCKGDKFSSQKLSSKFLLRRPPHNDGQHAYETTVPSYFILMQVFGGGSYHFPILQMRKLRLGEGKCIAQGHTAERRQSSDLNSFCLRPVSGCSGPGPHHHRNVSSPRWFGFGCIRSQLRLMGLDAWRHVVFYFLDQGSNPSPCTRRWILDHQTTRKVPHFFVNCVLLIHSFISMIVFL